MAAVLSGQGFQEVCHCKLIWLFQDVYQCRALLSSFIDGPDYASKCTSQFPWRVKLGQCTSQEQKGISLFIEWVNQSKDILVNFHVYVRKQTVLKPLFEKKYQRMFGEGKIWESPLLVTNEDFIMESGKEKSCSFWEIHLEFMWNEEVEPSSLKLKDIFDSEEKLLCFKEIGADLRKFFRNGKFSDICIKCENEEIPVHKAILEARCPYFAERINPYAGENLEDSGLAPPNDLNVMKAFLLYLYTGDIESLMENGPLPVGIHKCAQRMRRHDLEWIASPLQLCGVSYITSERIMKEFNIDVHRKEILTGVGFQKNVGKSLGGMILTVRVKPSMSRNSDPCVSVFLSLRELVKTNHVYVIFDVLVKNRKTEVISKRISDDLTPTKFIGFSELISVNKLLKPDTLLICKMSCYGDCVSTHVDKISLNCKIMSHNRASSCYSMSKFGKGCHGWINLSNDLSLLLSSSNYSDCVIVVGEDRLDAHRVVLAARSPYFSAIFKAKEEECEGSSNGMEIMMQNRMEIDLECMKIILDEIYTGCSDIPLMQYGHIHNFAIIFGLRILENKCVKLAGDVRKFLSSQAPHVGRLPNASN